MRILVSQPALSTGRVLRRIHCPRRPFRSALRLLCRTAAVSPPRGSLPPAQAGAEPRHRPRAVGSDHRLGRREASRHPAPPPRLRLARLLRRRAAGLPRAAAVHGDARGVQGGPPRHLLGAHSRRGVPPHSGRAVCALLAGARGHRRRVWSLLRRGRRLGAAQDSGAGGSRRLRCAEEAANLLLQHAVEEAAAASRRRGHAHGARRARRCGRGCRAAHVCDARADGDPRRLQG